MATPQVISPPPGFELDTPTPPEGFVLDSEPAAPPPDFELDNPATPAFVPQPPPVSESVKPRTESFLETMTSPKRWMESAGNAAGSLGKGVVALGEGVVGLADIATLGRAGKAMEDTFGYDPSTAKAAISDALQTEDLQRQQKNIAEAKGVSGTVKALLNNPTALADIMGESLPGMVGGAAIGKGAIKLAPKLSPIVAVAGGEGAIAGGMLAESIRQKTPDRLLTPKQASLAAAGGAATALISVLGGKIAQRLGLQDVDILISGASSQAAKRNVLTRVIGGAVTEGALEELPQSMQEAIAENLALGKKWNEGVVEQGIIGMALGSVMGGAANLPGDGRKPFPKDDDVFDAAKAELANQEALAGTLPEAAQKKSDILPRSDTPEGAITPESGTQVQRAIRKRRGATTAAETAAAKIPDSELLVSVQSPMRLGEKQIPGYVQIDSAYGKENQWSSNPDALRELGYDVPTNDELLTLPQGKYTLKQAKEKLAELKAKPSPESEAKADRDELAKLKEKDLSEDGLSETEQKRFFELSRKETAAKRSSKTKNESRSLSEAGVTVPDGFLNPEDGSENHITGWTRDKNGFIQIRVENHTTASMSPRLITVKPGDSLSVGMNDAVAGTTRYKESNPDKQPRLAPLISPDVTDAGLREDVTDVAPNDPIALPPIKLSQKPAAASPVAAVPVPKKSTPRSDSQEFDRLVAEHGLEQDWVTDVDGFYAEVGKYGDTASIESNKKKSKAYQAARRRAATAIGLKPDDVDTIQGRAKSLVKLKEYLAKLNEPDTLPDPEDANTDFLTPEDESVEYPKYPKLDSTRDKSKDIFKAFHDGVEAWKTKVRAWLAEQPEKKAIIWEEKATDYNGKTIKGNIKALTRNVGSRPWRVTTYWQRENGKLMSSGHQEYRTREEAMFEEGRNPGQFHERLPAEVMTEQEVQGYAVMDDVADKSKLIWYQLPEGETVGRFRERLRNSQMMQGFVLDSFTDGKVAFTKELPENWASDYGLKKVEPEKAKELEKKPETFEQRMAREEDANDWIKSALASKQPPKTADEAWRQFTAFDRSRGVETLGEEYFKSAWETFQKPKPTETRKGEVGGMLSSGEVVLTSSGRKTTPFPEVKTDTDRKTTATLKRVEEWLRQNALDEARSRNDEFNARMFEAEKAGNIPPASKDAMEEYLFGTQPDVPKPLLKTVSTTPEKPKFPVALAKRMLALSYERQTDAFGPSNESLRQDIIEAIHGKRPPKSKAGSNAVKVALANLFGIDSKSMAGVRVDDAIRAELQRIVAGEAKPAVEDPKLPSGVEPYAGAKGLESFSPKRGDVVWTTHSESGRLQPAIYEGKTGEKFDQHETERWTWIGGPDKGKSDQAYGRSFWKPSDKPVEPVKQEAKFKQGDEILFVPKAKGQSQVSGIVVEIIHNTDGEVGYHILSPLPNDPARQIRIWERDARAIGIATGKESDLPAGITVTRDKDFVTSGNYTVTDGTNTDKIFRDPENKWWYSISDFNKASKTAFPAQPLSTENRAEAIQKLVERWKKPKPPTMRPLTKAEAKEFAELSRIARAGREAGGPGLNTEQTKRYQYLEGLAGAQDLPIEPKKPEEPKVGPGGKLVVPKGNLTLTGEVQEKPTSQDDLFANLGGGMEVGTGWDEVGIRGAIAGEDTAGFKVNVISADEAVRITGVPESRGYGGFFYKGQAYLVSNNIGRNNTAGAKRLLREEVGHGLLRTKEGLELLTSAIESGRINLTEAEKQALRDEGYLENQLLDEFIAKSARENRSWWSDLVARTVRFLTGKGFKATNAEAARILLRQIRSKLGANGATETPTVRLKNAVLSALGVQKFNVPAAPAIVAYHGTPHKVDKFSTDKIGTGEGAQVYGWGLYMAQNPAVAKDYASKLGHRGEFRVDGKPMQANPADPMREALSLVSAYGWDAAKEEINKRVSRVYAMIESGREVADTLRYVGDVSRAVDQLKGKTVEPPAGNEYTVSLKVEDDELLDWDKPLSEQPEGVRKILRDAGVTDLSDKLPNGDNLPGGGLYRTLFNRKSGNGSADEEAYASKSASKYLASLGIKGIRYLDQGSRGVSPIDFYIGERRPGVWYVSKMTDPESPLGIFDNEKEAIAFKNSLDDKQPKPTYNYVIFDGNDIEITHENGKAVSPQSLLPELAPGRPEPLKQAVKMAAIDPANAAKNVKAAQASAEPVLGFMVREVQRLEAIASQPATTPAEKLRKAIAERTLKNRDFYRSIRRKVEQFLSSKRYTDDAVATYDEMKSELDVPNATQEQLDKMSNIAGNAVNELVDIENKRAEFNESYEAKRRDLMGKVASSTESEMEAYEKLEATETIVSDFRQMALPILRQSNDVAALQAYAFAIGRTEAVRRVLDFIGHEVDLTGARTANDVERLIREAAGRSRIQEHVEGVVGASRDVIQAVARIVALVEPIRERLIEARYLYGQQAGTRSTALKERVEELVRAGNFTRALEVFERGAEKVGAEHDRAVRELNFYARRTRSSLIALRALDETKAALDNIWNDPDFQAKRTEIFNRQGVASVTADLNGTTLILNAFPGQPKLKLVFGNDVSAEKSTLEQIREYKQNALAYIAGANPDPSVANGLKSTLPLLEQFLNSSFAPDAARLLPNWLLKGLNSAMTRVGSIERIPYYLLQGTGGAWRAIADASLRARRDMGEQLQRIHSEHFPKMGLKLHAALKSHGGITPDTYFDRVWNHLAASRQNFRDVKYLSEGDPIGNGEKVTKADLEYLEAYRKFHADLYNTSTNNGKRHFASFRSVLTGIFFDNNGRVRLPFAHGIDMVNRRAPSNTEISNWLKAWNNADKSSEKAESKKAFLDSQFNRLVIGYMHGVNQADWVSKFKYSYETQIREVLSESNEQPIDSFDTLVDRVFEKAINEEGEAAPQTREDVENNLLSDFDAIFKRLARYDPTEKKTDPKTGVEIVMSETEFNTERGNVIMPPNWYDYGGVTEGTWASISRASMFPYERAHLAAMQGLQSAIAEIVKDFKTQATSPSGRGMAAKGYFASRKQSRKSRERGELIYSWADAEDLLRKVTHYTGKLRAMAESPMLLTEMDRPNSILQKGGIQVVVSALLLRIPAMVRNLLGGYTNAVLDDMAFRSRSSYIAIPARAAEVVADVYKNTLTLLAHDGNPAGRALHKLLSEASSWNVIGPIAENLLKAVDEQRQLYRDSAELGLNLNVAFRDSMSVLWKFAKSGGSPREPGGPIAQWLSPVPTALRMGGLMMGQAGVGKVDSWINSKAYVQARQYEQVYKQMARKYGEQVAALGLRQFPPKAFGGEHQALRARDFFSRMSGLDIDAEMADYYKRWSEARAREESEGVKEGTYSDAVDLLNDEQRNTLSVAAADSFNLATFANRPYSTKSSNTASVLGLFYGYVDWWLHKLLSLANTNSRKGLAAGHLENLPFLVFAGLAFALVAMMKDDAIKWLKEYLLNQKGAYPRITEAKTAPAAARAVAGAVAADFPVAGGMASKAFDLGYSGGSNPYDLILALGMAKNLVDAGVETFQTGDATIPAMRLTDRYFSPIPLHKLTDKMSGTRALINTGNILESQVRAQNEEEKLKPRDAAGFDRDYTPATPLITRAMNAIGNGDMPEFQKQYTALVEEYRKQGKSDPERNARQSLMTRNPISQRFAKRPSEAEFAKYLSGLTETERKIVTDTLNNYRQAMSSIGASPTFTSGETRGGSASTSFEPATRAPAAGSSAPIGRGSGRVRSSMSSRRRYPTRVRGVRTRLSAPRRTRRVGRIRVRRSRIPRFNARIRRPRRIRVSPRPQFV